MIWIVTLSQFCQSVVFCLYAALVLRHAEPLHDSFWTLNNFLLPDLMPYTLHGEREQLCGMFAHQCHRRCRFKCCCFASSSSPSTPPLKRKRGTLLSSLTMCAASWPSKTTRNCCCFCCSVFQVSFCSTGIGSILTCCSFKQEILSSF